ncbi:MAG TPA: tetratricopeptide repeat protein [Crocinitomicaceae bacterium]|nr:tetratricopeptide repeat protein [Crocinitomicaceae bacterium]
MKVLLLIATLFSLTFSYGQQWRDSLQAARTAYENEEYTDALKYYQSAQKNAPENIDLSDEMAQSAYKARDFKKAEEIYKQSGAAKKDKIEKANNYHNIGNARMKSKDYSGAVESYKEALRNNPNDDQTRYNLSEAIRQLKQKQQQQQKDNKDNQDKKDKQDPKNNNDNQGDKKEGDNQQDQDGKPKSGDGDGGQENKSQLPNKTVDRMLDKLMKQEAETKRKASGTKGGSATPKSGKDW